MNKERYLELLGQDGDALAAAASKDLHAHVPSCPEWDMSDLVLHTGGVHRRRTEIVRRGSMEPPEERATEEPVDEGQLIDWYKAGLDELTGLLASSDPETPVWTWGKDQRIAFWIRRMAQETAVHRWDAEAAVAEPGSIDAELAADGIDEMLGEFIPREELAYEGAGGDLVLECTDVDGRWVVHLGPGEIPTYEADTGAAAVTVRAGASDLLLFLWRRIGPERVEVSGDAELARDFWRYLEGPGQ